MQPNDHAVATPIGARLCEKCSAKIFAPATTGFCSACLLEEGLDLLAGEDFASLGETAPADFGDYELLGEIGRGGQGVVFRARQKSLNRIVALKIIALGTLATETHLKRFRREAEAAARLEHPRIVPIYEIGEREGACYFTMQLVDGGQLGAFVKGEPWPLRPAAEIIASVAHTVHYAHERGILHRDIKPGNILLDAEGEPHLADFGLARLSENESTVTRTLEVLGTPSFIAPEQAAGNGASSTSATDVYGLGAVFYHLLTGHPPFAGGTTYETIRLVLETEPRNPKLWNAKVDRDLATICLKCLEKDPLRRYPSALALAEDLERWLGHEPIRARHAGIFHRGRKWVRRHPSRVALLSLGTALFGVIGLLFWNREPPRAPAGIAVLPFENLDGNKANVAFVDGIQDDIQTKLARIADLKVISRNSVMHYRGARNTRQIGDALRVSHLLEGSVRRENDRVRLNVQLIDVRTDEHIWAEEYDRDLKDVFAIQSEIAEEIAEELHTKLSPHEKAELDAAPTKDLQAYDFYMCGAAIFDGDLRSATTDDLLRAIGFFEKAIARDPRFVLAYCKLAEADDFLYFVHGDSSPGRLALAASAIDSAFRLAPQSGEAHFASASHFYWGKRDYNRARDELTIAGRILPNNPQVANLTGLIDRRAGRWADAVQNLARAIELDPHNRQDIKALATTYTLMREYDKAAETLDRGLALNPADVDFRLMRACLDLPSRADTRPPHAILDKVLADNPALARDLADAFFWVAWDDRNIVAASHALTTLDENALFDIGPAGSIKMPRAFFEGMLARKQGDEVAARAALLAARVTEKKIVREQPDDPMPLAGLGQIDAQLGRNAEALQESRRAVELMPLTRSALEGPDALWSLAIVSAWIGEHDLAIAELEKVAKIPAGPSYGDLRLDPALDSLRSDPRFQKIVASLAPKADPRFPAGRP